MAGFSFREAQNLIRSATEPLHRSLKRLECAFSLPDPSGDLATFKALNQYQTTLDGVGTWSPPSELVSSYSYIVVTVGDELDPPTYTDSGGTVTDLYANESTTYSINSPYELMDTSPVITTKAGDIVKIIYTERT